MDLGKKSQIKLKKKKHGKSFGEDLTTNTEANSRKKLYEKT